MTPKRDALVQTQELQLQQLLLLPLFSSYQRHVGPPRQDRRQPLPQARRLQRQRRRLRPASRRPGVRNRSPVRPAFQLSTLKTARWPSCSRASQLTRCLTAMRTKGRSSCRSSRSSGTLALPLPSTVRSPPDDLLYSRPAGSGWTSPRSITPFLPLSLASHSLKPRGGVALFDDDDVDSMKLSLGHISDFRARAPEYARADNRLHEPS